MEKINLKNLDKKTKIEIAITAVMVAALVVILSSSMKAILRAKRPSKPPPITPVAFKEIARRDISISAKSEQIEKAYREAEAKRAEGDIPWGRDPFAVKFSPQKADVSVLDLALEGIMWDDEKPFAIINGEVVKEGDKIGKITVIQIQKDAVIVSDGAKRYRLQFW